ncbi:class I SAM-dependent methyltransferase [Amycolatopsis panacis]|uniref:class I SAM-dependent methyltransferase n=1 Tax=Amycolatopsis panacis TaxID=2340917 RepID=UPI001F3E89F6|nr:class I SAM-dependent methyltransferase [Amycolatopsis panacis]
MEIGSLHGWSTSRLLRALADNETGRLVTADLIDRATETVPKSLPEGRWEFRKGHAKPSPATGCPMWTICSSTPITAPASRAGYLADVFPVLRPGIPVSVHEVFHRAVPLPFTEGVEVLRWLDRAGTAYFTAARARAPRTGWSRTPGT